MMPQQQEFSALKAYLNLTDAQLEQIGKAGERARKEAAEKTKALMLQIEEKRRALHELLAKGTNDPNAVGKATLEIQNLQKQAGQLHDAVRKSQLDVLTAEQRTKFKAIEEAALLPEATREAMRLGLVPRPQGQPGPMMMNQGQGMPGQGQGMMQGRQDMMRRRQEMMQRRQGMMQQGPGMNQQQGPGPNNCPCQNQPDRR
jgi:Spy/CpxP family protein refolding chaperone